MNAEDNSRLGTKRLFGWIGLTCLLLIIPVKITRFIAETTAATKLIGIFPSFLGPAGLFFLILSASKGLSRLTMNRAAALAAVIALTLEFLQLLPRPGILAKVHYTFDWLDIIASLLSICVAYFVAPVVIDKTSQKKK